MIYTMRQYTIADYPMIESWWKTSDMPVPPINAIPEDTTFIVEMDGIAAVVCSLIETNIKAYAYIDFLVGNPEIQDHGRRLATHLIFSFIDDLGRQKGYDYLIGFSMKPKLTEYYLSQGFRKTFSNLTCIVRDL